MANLNAGFTINDDTGTAGDNITTDQTIIISGTFDAPIDTGLDSFSIEVNGVTYTIASPELTFADGFTTWHLDLTGTILSANEYTVNIIYTPSGGGGQPYSNTFTIDITPPSALVDSTITFSDDTGISGTDLITKIAAQTISGTFTGTLEPSDFVEVSINNGSTWTKATVSQDIWSLAGQTLSGTDTIRVRVSDVAGNSSASQTAVFTIDTTSAPTPAITAGISEDSGTPGDDITKDTTPTISGTAEANAIITIYDGDSNNKFGTTTASSSGAWSYTFDPQTSGNYTIKATATDVAGNAASSRSDLLIFTIDTEAPTPALLNLDDSTNSGSKLDLITNSVRPTITGTGEEGSTITFYLGGTEITSFPTVNGKWSYTLESDLETGFEYTFYTKETDNAGNQSDASPNLVITVDTKSDAPTALDLTAESDSGIADDDNITNSTYADITGKSEAGAKVYIYDGETEVDSVIADGSGNWIYLLDNWSTGKHTITAKTEDVAGNISSASTALEITIDRVSDVPTALDLATASDSGVNTDNITNATSVNISGKAEAGAKVFILIEDEIVNWVTANGSGDWTDLLSNLSPGKHTITAIAQDIAGNQLSESSSALEITVDTSSSIPTELDFDIDSDSGVNDDNITKDTSPRISGTADAGAWVTIYDGETLVGTTDPADSNGYWTFTFVDLDDREYVITATATDIAGNTSEASASLTFTIDTVAPDASTFPVIAAGKNSGISDDNITNTPVITGKAEPFNTINLYVGGNTLVGTAVADDQGVWSKDLSTLDDGSYTVSAISVDIAGNSSLTAPSFELIVDTSAPILTISGTPSTISAGQSSTITFSFDESPAGSFDVNDISTSGGQISNFSGSGKSFSATFTADQNSNSGLATISVNAEQFADVAGNTNSMSKAEIQIGNSTPTTSNKTATMLEDDDYIFSTADFSFSDVNKADTLQFIKITSLPSDGNLVFNESAAYKGQEIAVNRLNELIFSPYANDNGTGYASFAFMVSDGEAYSESSANWTVNVTPVNDTPEGSVSISGKNNVGQTLGAYASIDEPDGIVGNLRYQWLANDNIIRGAISSTYKLITADIGKTIKVVVSYLDGDGFTESFTSSATLPIANLNNAPTGTVKITGTAIQGATLTASNTIMDIDGIGGITFAPSNPISYQWKANGVIINDGDSDHDDSTFVLSQEQVNKKITVEAIYVDNKGNAEKVSSTTTALVRNVNDAPTGGIVISDSTPQVGQTLTIINTVGDLDGLPTNISYQWTADGVVIRGAASTSYIVRSSDLGKEIKVIMTYTDMLGMTERVESNPTEDVTPSVPLIAPVNPPPSNFSSMSSLLWAGQLLESSSSGSSSPSEHGHQYQDSVVDMIGIANSEFALF